MHLLSILKQILRNIQLRQVHLICEVASCKPAVLGVCSLVWVLDAQQTTSRSAKINEEMMFFFQRLFVLP
jgi:hypothetical protein